MIASLVMALLYSRYFLCELFALVRAVRISYARAVRMAAVVLRFLLWPSGGGLNRFCCVLLAAQMPAFVTLWWCCGDTMGHISCHVAVFMAAVVVIK